MICIFRMLQLVFWHTSLLEEFPRKTKQRVKLRAAGMVATALNPVMGSALECMGTVTKITERQVFVRWDNNSDNIYPSNYLIIADFPLKFLPKFIKLGKDNPNVTFKELESYKMMEKEWLEYEERVKNRENDTVEIAQGGHIGNFELTFDSTGRREVE